MSSVGSCSANVATTWPTGRCTRRSHRLIQTSGQASSSTCSRTPPMSNTTALIAIRVPSSRFVTVLVIPGAVGVLACAHRPWPVVSSWFTNVPFEDRYRMAPCNNCGMEPDVADLTLPEEDRQELIRWTVACVERLLPVFEADRPEDPRLSDALDGARQFAAGRLSVGPMRKLAFGCHAAAREASTAPATAVARACGQAVAVAHMAGHSREIVR